MGSRDLHDLLQELHDELEGSATVDESAKEKLRVILRDIRPLLEKKPAGGDESGKTMAESFRDAVRQFEAEHPQLVRASEELIDTLNRMGL